MTSNARTGDRILGTIRSAEGKGIVHMEDRFDAQVSDVWLALTDRRRPGSNLLRAEIVTPHCPETPGARHGGDERRSLDRAHAPERNRMLDLQHIADRRADHDCISRSLLAIRRTRRPHGSASRYRPAI